MPGVGWVRAGAKGDQGRGREAQALSNTVPMDEFEVCVWGGG